MKKPKLFYGWWIVAASFICICIYSGVGYYAFSLFVEPLEREFGWSRAQISASFTIVYTTIALSAPFIGRFIDRYNPRRMMVFGAIVLGLGFILLSRIQSLWYYYCAYVLVGLGCSCSGFMPTSALVSNWFSRRRGLALGITMTGIGVGGMVIASFLGAFIIPHYGWRNAYFYMAFLVWLVVIPIAIFVLKTRPSDMGLRPDGATKEDVSTTVLDKTNLDNWTLRKALKTLPFWLILISFSAGSFANTAMVQQQLPHLRDMGFNLTIAVTALGAVGIGSTAGKFIFGWLSDIIPVKYSQSICFIFGTIAIVIFMNVSIQTSSWILWTYAIFIGLAMGGWASNTPMMVSTMFGLKSYGSIYGTINLPIMLSTAFGPLVAATIRDATNSYRTVFILSIILSSIAILTMTILPRPKQTRSQINE